MDKKIFEEAPKKIVSDRVSNTTPDRIKKQARQLAYDIRYKVKGRFKEGQKTDRNSLKQAFMQELGKSSAPGPVKILAKRMLIGEQYDYVDVAEMAESSTSLAYSKVFLHGLENIEEAKTKKTYVLRVKDPKAGTIYYRSYNNYAAAEAKKLQLEKKGLKVEFTSKESETYDRKAKKDYDGDGKVESGSKEHAGVVHNAIQRKKGGNPDGQDTRSEEFIYEKEGSEKIDILPKGKKGCTVKINPNIGEQIKYASQYFYEMGLNENGVEILIEQLGLENFVDYVSDIVEQSLLTEARSARRRTGGPSYAEVKAAIDAKEKVKKAKSSTPTRKTSVTKAKSEQKPTPKPAPKKHVLDGISRTILRGIDRHNQAMKKAKSDIETTKKVARTVGRGAREFGKGFVSGVKTAGKAAQAAKRVVTKEEMDGVRYCPKCDKDETRDECKYGGEYWDENSKPAKAVDSRAVPAMVNLVKNKMRARGLNMSYDMEGNSIDENSKKMPYGAKADKAVASVRDQLAKYSDEKLEKIRKKNLPPAPIGVKG